MILIGLFLAGAYVWGVLEVLVEKPPDRSWLFWGLGVAFIGIMLTGGGLDVAFLSRSLFRSRRHRD
jgi:hypothetical protein